jgi:hypothetical protein
MYTGLNYIDVLGIVSLDQATAYYLPSITNAHISYFNSIDKSIQIQRSSEIVSVQYELQRGCVISRMYYRVFANTPQPYNAFNYQIQNTIYKIQTAAHLLPIVSRGSIPTQNQNNMARADLITRVQKTNNKNLILKWLPHFFIQTMNSNAADVSLSSLTLERKAMLENVLVNFWQKQYMKQNNRFNKIEIQLITSDLFYDAQSQTYAIRVYYMIAVNDFVKYNNQLPTQNKQLVRWDFLLPYFSRKNLS